MNNDKTYAFIEKFSSWQVTSTYSGKYSNMVDDGTPHTSKFFLSGSRRFTKIIFGRSEGGRFPPQSPRGAATASVYIQLSASKWLKINERLSDKMMQIRLIRYQHLYRFYKQSIVCCSFAQTIIYRDGFRKGHSAMPLPTPFGKKSMKIFNSNAFLFWF